MSAFAAVVSALVLIILLGAFAAYLVNVPVWAVAVIAGALLAGLYRMAKRYAERAQAGGSERSTPSS
jgi:hypothetical protein